MEQLKIHDAPSEVAALQERLGVEWKSINQAAVSSHDKRVALSFALARRDSEDTSIVVFGSLARDEYTQGSDIDWTLLIDGFADAKYLDLAKEIRQVVQAHSAKQPGREAVSGTMAFSHELIHQISGEDDTNTDTTRRILLEDRSFLRAGAKHHVPRFLLNDFARYWRTMAVDFAYKAKTRSQEGAAIRNLKLRMSRKLIYVSGLLNCFTCHLEMKPAARTEFFERPDADSRFIKYFRERIRRTPLEVLASVLMHRPNMESVAVKILGAYEASLDALSDGDKRTHLERLPPEKEDGDPVYQGLRTA